MGPREEKVVGHRDAEAEAAPAPRAGLGMAVGSRRPEGSEPPGSKSPTSGSQPRIPAPLPSPSSPAGPGGPPHTAHRPHTHGVSLLRPLPPPPPRGCKSPLLGAQVLPVIHPFLLQQQRRSRTPTPAVVIALVFVDLCSEHLLLLVPFGLAAASYARPHTGCDGRTPANSSPWMGGGGDAEVASNLLCVSCRPRRGQRTRKPVRRDLPAAGLRLPGTFWSFLSESSHSDTAAGCRPTRQDWMDVGLIPCYRSLQSELSLLALRNRRDGDAGETPSGCTWWAARDGTSTRGPQIPR